jgi:hypothetical protein
VVAADACSCRDFHYCRSDRQAIPAHSPEHLLNDFVAGDSPVDLRTPRSTCGEVCPRDRLPVVHHRGQTRSGCSMGVPWATHWGDGAPIDAPTTYAFAKPSASCNPIVSAAISDSVYRKRCVYRCTCFPEQANWNFGNDPVKCGNALSFDVLLVSGQMRKAAQVLSFNHSILRTLLNPGCEPGGAPVVWGVPERSRDQAADRIELVAILRARSGLVAAIWVPYTRSGL